MKYLKIYERFDGISSSKKLRELTKNYLAYLIDDGLEIDIELGDENILTLILNRYGNSFNWSDIKDTFIPFLQILLENYNIKDRIRFGRTNDKWLPAKFFIYNKLINDYVDIDNIITISINLKEK